MSNPEELNKTSYLFTGDQATRIIKKNDDDIRQLLADDDLHEDATHLLSLKKHSEYVEQNSPTSKE